MISERLQSIVNVCAMVAAHSWFRQDLDWIGQDRSRYDGSEDRGRVHRLILSLQSRIERWSRLVLQGLRDGPMTSHRQPV